MTTPTLSVAATKPGAPGLAHGENFGSRTNVRLLVGATEIAYFTTAKGTFDRSLPAQAAGDYQVSALSTRGCATATWKVAAVPPDPPVSGIPVIPAGARWSKNFADGKLEPFRVLTIPSDPNHVATDPMAKYNRYGTAPVIAGGFARMNATRRPDGLYDSTLIGTTDDGHGGAATHRLRTGRVLVPVRMNVGYVTWQTPLWLVGWVDGHWNSTEIDIAEVINGKLTWNMHGVPGQGQFASVAPPPDLATTWHMAGVLIAPTYVAALWDGNEIGRWNGSITHDLAYVGDSKIGIPWENKGPTAATPDPTFADIAWIAEYAA